MPSPANQWLRVFASSTHAGNKELRQRVHDRIRSLGLVPVFSESWVASTAGTATVCKAQAAAADVLVLILRWRYGTKRSDSQVSFIEGASRASVKCLAFLQAEDVAITVADFEAPEHRHERTARLFARGACATESNPHAGARPRIVLHELFVECTEQGYDSSTILEGDPGRGKTKFLTQLLRDTWEHKARRIHREMVPVLLSLRGGSTFDGGFRGLIDP